MFTLVLFSNLSGFYMNKMNDILLLSNDLPLVLCSNNLYMEIL